ncbi:MAG: tetratricopeptide repeat protein [SAR324 cluster bacterium]|nr:tetratricopeptide repeat protein [SAR324 cluster bacterium]
MKQYMEAAQSYSKALELQPDNPSISRLRKNALNLLQASQNN